jgi:PKD domain
VVFLGRSLSPRLARRAPAAYRLTGIVCLPLVLAWALIALATFSASAKAVVTEVGTTKIGLQPREESRYWEGFYKWNGIRTPKGSHQPEAESNVPVTSFSNNPLHPDAPGPVMHSVATYAIYWDPQDYYHGDWQGLIDGFLANVGSYGGELSNVFAVDAQYTDRSNKPAADRSAFRGAYTDTNPYPESENCTDPHPLELGMPLLESDEPVCLTDKQVRAQLETFITQHGIAKGMGTLFYLLTPPGVTVCLDAGGPEGHCSDFDGTTSEISQYEEAKATYPERLSEYEKELAQYEKEKEKAEKEGKAFNGKLPAMPVEPAPPAGYVDYKKSFCSYHSDISPTNPENGDGNTILYATIPWVAGGWGDYHLASVDRTEAADCQDGGFQPATEPGGQLEEKEHGKTRTPKEQEEFEEKTKKEQREEEEARELGLEKPHDQEPNQLSSSFGPDGSYDTGLADLIIGQIAVEQQNTVTDPLLTGWQDLAGNEVTDECRNSFFPSGGSASANPLTGAGILSNQALGAGKYYLNDAYNLASQRLPYPGVPCMHDIVLEPKFTAPNVANAGEVVGFDGMESDITLDSAVGFSASGAPQNNYATYTWNFGDGSPDVSGFAPGAPTQNSPASTLCAEPWLSPCAASAYHSYQYGGTYSVTLTVTDVGGNTASVTEPITVLGPLPPSTPASPSAASSGSGGSTGSGVSSGGSSQGQTGTISSAPAPVVTAAIASTSLKKVKTTGVAVHYTVNEQVAGSVQVLIESSVAKRLGIKGPVATGLAQGTPSEIVIGAAVIVTTKAGTGTVHIKFASKTAARLARSHKLKLTLRLVARNASRTHPLSTTTLSTVVLSG